MRVVVASPLTDELCNLITELEPRIDLICEQDLLPPMRWPGDHDGDPEFARTPEQQARFEELLHSGEAYYGIPDTSPALLAKVARNAPDLYWVHTMAAGGGAQIKAADLAPEDLERITVTTSAGPHGGPLAEFATLGVLAGAKNLPRLLADKSTATWPIRWHMKNLRYMTVCVVALGNIGRSIVQRMSALGANVIGVNPSLDPVEGVSKIYLPEDIDKAVAEADAVVNAAPGTDATLKLIGKKAFAAMKRDTIVVNVGRGTVIDEAALVDALLDGTVGFAALDVFEAEPLPQDSPLWKMENVLISPHIAGLDPEEDRIIAEMFAANATAILDGKTPKNLVNKVEFY